MAQSHAHDAHSPAHYVKIWGVLMVLLFVSIAGPEISPHLGAAGLYVMLFTAFGIAFVKAWLVVKHFMHLTVEKTWVGQLLLTCVTFLLLFLAGTAPDVMNHTGANWQNLAAQEEVRRVLAEHDPEALAAMGYDLPTSEDEQPEEPTPEPEPAPTYAAMTSDGAKQRYLKSEGERLYTEKNCITCHRSDGSGHGQFPPLAGQGERMGDCAKTIDIIKNGMNETYEIDGTTYSLPMAGTDVTDEEGAALATFIRTSWGNTAGPCLL